MSINSNAVMMVIILMEVEMHKAKDLVECYGTFLRLKKNGQYATTHLHPESAHILDSRDIKFLVIMLSGCMQSSAINPDISLR